MPRFRGAAQRLGYPGSRCRRGGTDAKALWLGPVQEIPKHGSVVWDMNMIDGLGAWQCGRLYPPQGQVSDDRLDRLLFFSLSIAWSTRITSKACALHCWMHMLKAELAYRLCP